MKLGACTKSFGGKSLSETAKIFSAAGLKCVELCFCQKDLSGWRYNFSGYEALPSLENVLEAKEIFGCQNIETASLGVYNCLWSGGVETMAESLKYFCEYCDIALGAGINLISTHTGLLNLWSGRKARTEDFLERVFECITYAAVEAEKRGLTVALECTPTDALCGYKDFLSLKKYIKEIVGRCDMIKYTALPCFCEDICEYNDAAMFCIRDKKQNGKYYEPYGSGEVSFADFFRSIKKDDTRAVILEYVDERTVGETVRKIERDFLCFGEVKKRN